MRQVISLSVPTKQAGQIRKLAALRGYRTVSHYLTSLVMMDADLISEDELLQAVKQARSEYRKGKVIKAKLLDDLL